MCHKRSNVNSYPDRILLDRIIFRQPASITTTHLGCDACRWPVSFVNVRRATVLSVRALRSFPEAVRQTVVAILDWDKPEPVAMAKEHRQQ